jgi:hypothetical protein
LLPAGDCGNRDIGKRDNGVKMSRATATSKAQPRSARAPEATFVCDAAGLADAIARLKAEDALSLPLISEATRATLLAASQDLAYRPAKPRVGEGPRVVLQDFEICMDIPKNSAFQRFALAFEQLTNEALARLDPRPCDALHYNNLVVQRYDPGPVGITPHRDHICYEGLVSLVILSGSARFLVSADRSGRGAREIPNPPGCLLLMRGAGFAGLKDRPFHQLCDIKSDRVSFGIRYDSRAEAP